ncbi:MAG: Mut7-C RNAse domain-containing protein [Pseudomonadota bacterium]
MSSCRALFRFYEELNDFLPQEQRKRDIEQCFEPPVPVRHLIETLGVPHTEVEVVLVNGVSVDLEHSLRDGDRVSVYPVFESLDITPLLQIRPNPLRNPRFLADAHLGKLAHLLRMLGFDTLFFNDAGDLYLASLSADQGRVLLTRDRALLMRRKVTHGCYIRSVNPREQLFQVLNRLDLLTMLRPFTRCMECNSLLQSVPKSDVEDGLPKGVVRHYNAFWRCTGCGRVYWKGHHYQAMRDWTGKLQNELSVNRQSENH